jgi:hypothetical protein
MNCISLYDHLVITLVIRTRDVITCEAWNYSKMNSTVLLSTLLRYWHPCPNFNVLCLNTPHRIRHQIGTANERLKAGWQAHGWASCSSRRAHFTPVHIRPVFRLRTGLQTTTTSNVIHTDSTETLSIHTKSVNKNGSRYVRSLNGRSQRPRDQRRVCLGPHEQRDRGFESHSRYGCMGAFFFFFLVCSPLQVEALWWADPACKEPITMSKWIHSFRS